MKKVIIALIAAVIGIQLIPVKRTNPDVISDFSGPADVKAILKRSCYDCHSNETRWPWYSYVAPVSWLVAHDVEEGRAYLNFSNWAPLKDMVYIHHEIYEEVAEGEMPMKAYLLMHSNAKMSAEDQAVLKEWAGK